jgi:hypothetical protein
VRARNGGELVAGEGEVEQWGGSGEVLGRWWQAEGPRYAHGSTATSPRISYARGSFGAPRGRTWQRERTRAERGALRPGPVLFYLPCFEIA